MVGVGGLGLERRCRGPTLSALGRPPPPPPPCITPLRQQQQQKNKEAFFPCLVSPSRGTATTATTPTPLHLPSPSSFLFKYCKPSTSPCHCTGRTDVAEPEPPESTPVDGVGTGSDVECVVVVPPADTQKSSSSSSWWEWAVLVSPFFFWGTAMVAMKPVIPKTGPLFVSAFRLIPAGLLLVAFAASQRRRPPSGLQAWLSISLFALVDASCFQVPPFLLGRFLWFCPALI